MKSLKDQYKIDEYIILKSNFQFSEDLYHGKKTEIVENFNCLICLIIVDNPVKCGNCSKLYCETCIENSLIKNIDRCPHCLSSPFNKDHIDLLRKEILDETQFRCPLECGQVIRYSEKEKHKKECKNIQRFNKCSLCNFEVGQNNKDVHQKDCSLLKSSCVSCDESLIILDYENHLKTCKNQMKICEELNIFYSFKYEEAYKQEFKELLSTFENFYKWIKMISNINI